MFHDHLQHSQHIYSDQRASSPKSFWRSRYAIGFLAFSAVAAYFLLSEHRAHFLGVLPWLLILACPLMHVFMHGAHGDHGDHANGHDQRDDGQRSTQLTKDKGEKP